MLGQFLATFAGVILSFLLWFGGEKVFQHQREKKARAHLTAEIIEEIKNNVILLGNFAITIERMLEGGRIAALGSKLITSAQSSAISSGELRLLSDPEKRQAVRFSTHVSQEFDHFVENTELLLAIGNLKPQEQALRQATERLNGLRKDAISTAKYLQSIIDQLTGPKK